MSNFDSKYFQDRAQASVYANIDSNLLIINEDRLKLKLINYKKSVNDKSQIWTPIGLIISFLLTFATASFNDYLGLSKETWEALFIFLLVGSIGWLIFLLFRMKKRYTIDHLIEDCKNIGSDSPKTEENGAE